MRPLREPNGSPITEDDYMTCKLGLHGVNERVLATERVECYNNALQTPAVVHVCEDCAKTRLGAYRDMFNFVVVTTVGKVKKPR